jgi:cell division protein FtsL
MHRIVNLVLIALTLASAFTLYSIKYGTRRMEARVAAQERRLERAEADVQVLRAERAYLARPERLEPLARKLGMAPVTPRQYVRVDMEGPPAQERAGAEPTRRR